MSIPKRTRQAGFALLEVMIAITILAVNDQTVAGTVNSAAPAATSDMLVFKRRWLIEPDTPAPRVRRITIIIIPQTGTNVEKGAFQTSMVRPCHPIAGC
jgi:prepilin-type N-terminal cleavage/methylation domain-containing protein